MNKKLTIEEITEFLNDPDKLHQKNPYIYILRTTDFPKFLIIDLCNFDPRECIDDLIKVHSVSDAELLYVAKWWAKGVLWDKNVVKFNSQGYDETTTDMLTFHENDYESKTLRIEDVFFKYRAVGKNIFRITPDDAISKIQIFEPFKPWVPSEHLQSILNKAISNREKNRDNAFAEKEEDMKN